MLIIEATSLVERLATPAICDWRFVVVLGPANTIIQFKDASVHKAVGVGAWVTV